MTMEMTMTDRDRPLPDYHEGLLKTALKLEPTDDLPADIIDLYWSTERTARSVGCRIGNEMLVTICLMASRTTPANPVSFLDEKPRHGDRVLAKFRNEWRWGVYLRTHGKAIVVQIYDNTAEEREFGPTHVRWPSKEELKLIGE